MPPDLISLMSSTCPASSCTFPKSHMWRLPIESFDISVELKARDYFSKGETTKKCEHTPMPTGLEISITGNPPQVAVAL